MAGIMQMVVNNVASQGVVTSGSAQFSGTNYLDVASTAAFGFGTADFTIECWWRPTVNQRSDVLDFWSTPGGGSYPVTRFDFGRITSTTLDLYTDGTGGSGPKITGPTIASLLNVWHHIAITRQSGSIKMWVDGTQAGSTYSANVLDMGANMQLRIMGDHGAAGNGSGNLSNIRVVRGVAVYTGAFTPPTAPLTVTQSEGTNISAITAGQTQLLLNTVSGANFLVDSSTNAITVTNTGTVTSSVLNPFYGGVTNNLVLYYDPSNSSSYSGSGTTINSLISPNLAGTMSDITFTNPYFTYNGTSSTVSVADTASLEPGAGDFTVEAWVYYSAITGSSRCFVSKTDNGGLASAWSYGLRTSATGSTYIEVGNGTTSVTSPTYNVSTGQWYQIVGVWTNVATNSIELYVNGASQGSNSHSFASVKNSTNPLYLGSYNGGEFGQWLNGRMGIVRYYNAALSSSQVLQNFNANRSVYGL